MMLGIAGYAQETRAKITAIVPTALYANGAAITITSGTSVRVNGNAVLSTGSSLTNNGTLSLTGDLASNQIMTTANTGKLIFSGSTAQTLNGSQTYLAKDVLINNAAGIILQAPLQVDGTVTFTNGVLSATNSSYPLIIASNGFASGASNASHVNGYVQKLGIGTFVFPVGNGTRYQPISADLTTNSNGLRARYYAADAGIAAFGTTGTSPIALEAYNSQEYWDLSPVGTATGKVMITWDDFKNPSITTSTNINVFKVAHKTAAGWLNEGSSVITGTTIAGSVTSATVSSWSPFTLGTISASVLPVTLISFMAKEVEGNAILNWQTTSETNASHFEVQRSTDARNFEEIGRVDAAGNSSAVHNYAFTDTRFSTLTPIVYYRLRPVDLDDTYAYSRTVSLKRTDTMLMAKIYPNPAQTGNSVTVEANTSLATITVWNMLGREIAIPVSNKTNGKAELNLSGITSGVYLLQVKTPAGSTTKKLVVVE